MKYQTPIGHPRLRGEVDCVRTVSVEVVLSDEELAHAFCGRGDRHQAVTLNAIASEFSTYSGWVDQTMSICDVENDGEALTEETVRWLENLASCARQSLIERNVRA